MTQDHTTQEPHASDVEIVTTQPRLAEVVAAASGRPRVALDIESNGFHRYPERVCLVQLASSGSAYLIDPLALTDVAHLGKLTADASVEKVLHSADYDLRSLDRDWGFHVRNLFDTSIAASFLGSPRLGLAAVLHDYLGVELNKSKKLQRADWTNRPLSPEARRYAADDVHYLERLRDTLVRRLADLSRREWVAEECERLTRVRYKPPDRTLSFASIKGSRDLDGAGLAVLRSLHGFREREAVQRDRPPFKVIGNDALLALAANPHADLASVKGLGRFGHAPEAGRVRAAIREGLQAPPVKRPRRPRANGRRLSAAERAEEGARLQGLKKWRTGLGQQLGLDPSLLWPAASLERLSRQPDTLGDETKSAEVRAWQRHEFEDSLRDCMATLTAGAAAR